MTSRAVRLALSLLAVCPAFTGRAADTEPAAGLAGAYLAVPQGARAVAMGEAYAALSDDSDAVAWNPAGLPLASLPAVRLTHSEWLTGMRFENLTGGFRLGEGAAGFSVGGLWLGGVPVRDSAGTLSGATASGSELVLRAAYGRSIGKGLGAGAAVTGLSQSLAGRRFSSLAGSAGVLWLFTRAVRLGAYVSNLGSAPAGFSLPLLGAAGLSYTAPDGRWAAALDGRVVAKAGTSIGAGIEYLVGGSVRVRAGYRGGAPGSEFGPLGGLRAGLGARFRLAGTVGELDYALAPFGELGLTHRIGVGLTFPPPPAAERPRPSLGLIQPPSKISVAREPGQLDLRWEAVPDAAGYNIYLAEAGSGLRRMNTTPYAKTEVKIRGAGARALVISITSVDADGIESLPSSPLMYAPPTATPTATPRATATPTAAPRRTGPAPTPPRAFGPPDPVRVEAGRNQITLRWDAVPGAVGYHVYLSFSPTAGGGQYVRLTSTPVPRTEFSYPAPGGTTVYFHLSAVDAQGRDSGFTREIPATTK